jgi:hypothetical protein
MAERFSMMGSNEKPQDELFYAFNLEDVVPQDHLLRALIGFSISPVYASTWRLTTVIPVGHRSTRN